MSNLYSTQKNCIQLYLLLNFSNILGHLHMIKIQKLAKEGLFGSNITSISNCQLPLSKASIHSKQHNHEIKYTTLHPLDNLYLTLGDCIILGPSSSTMLESTLHPTTSTGVKESTSEKQNFELLAHSFNYPICQYHTDNGVFASHSFNKACKLNHKCITYREANVHHQNDITEHYIVPSFSMPVPCSFMPLSIGRT